MHKKLRVLGEYVGQLVIGAAMFSAVLLFGVGLSLLVQWSEPVVSDAGFSQLMKLVEKIIIYSDVMFVVWWVVFSTYNALKEMYDE